MCCFFKLGIFLLLKDTEINSYWKPVINIFVWWYKKRACNDLWGRKIEILQGLYTEIVWFKPIKFWLYDWHDYTVQIYQYGETLNLQIQDDVVIYKFHVFSIIEKCSFLNNMRINCTNWKSNEYHSNVGFKIIEERCISIVSCFG